MQYGDAFVEKSLTNDSDVEYGDVLVEEVWYMAMA